MVVDVGFDLVVLWFVIVVDYLGDLVVFVVVVNGGDWCGEDVFCGGGDEEYLGGYFCY